MVNPNDNFDVWKREEYRKSMDTLLVFNPTNSDYICYWDKYPHVIPAHNKDMGFGPGKMQLVRYIADKYMKEMKDKLITEKADELLTLTKKDRANRGLSVDPGEVNLQVMNTLPKTSNEKEIENAYSVLFCGVVREFGLYDMPEQLQDEKIDLRTPEEKAMERVMNKKNNVEAKTEPKLDSAEAKPQPKKKDFNMDALEPTEDREEEIDKVRIVPDKK